MQRTRAQVQLQYHQTLNRIVEMELLAEQLTRLADSYRKEEQGRRPALREEETRYAAETKEAGSDAAVQARTESTPGETLQSQAKELRSAAEDWYRRAREEYRMSLHEIRQNEERNRAW